MASGILFGQDQNRRQIAPGSGGIGLELRCRHVLRRRFGVAVLIAKHASVEHSHFVVARLGRDGLFDQRLRFGGLFDAEKRLRERQAIRRRRGSSNGLLQRRERFLRPAEVQQQRSHPLERRGIVGELAINRDGVGGLMFLFVERSQLEQVMAVRRVDGRGFPEMGCRVGEPTLMHQRLPEAELGGR